MTRNNSTQKHKTAIITLTKDIMLDNYDRIKELLDLIPGRKWSREEITADRPMKWEYSLLAMDDKKIIGVRLISKKGDTRHHHMTSVDTSNRRSGIGSTMMFNSATMAKTLGESFVTVKVEDGNEMSMNFHLKLGFSVYGEERNDEEGVTYYLLRGTPDSILTEIEKTKN